MSEGGRGGMVAVAGGVVLLCVGAIVISSAMHQTVEDSHLNVELKQQIEGDVARVESLQHKVEVARETLESHIKPREERLSRVAALDERLRELRVTEEKTRLARESAIKAYSELRSESESYRRQARHHARSAMVGRRFDTLESSRGKSYREVEIRDFDERGLLIRHAGGTARLGYDELPDELRDEVLWEPGESP